MHEVVHLKKLWAYWLMAALTLTGCASAPETAPPVTDALTVVKASEQERPVVAQPGRTEQQVIASVQIENSVFFKRRSTELDEASRKQLQQHAERLKSNPKQHVTLVGFTENLGSRSYSLAIAERRVNGVFSLLRNYGVPVRQLSRKTAGVELTSKACNSEECRRLMRRVELKLLNTK